MVDYLLPEWSNVRFFAGDCPDAGLSNGSSLSKAALVATGPSSMPTRFVLGTTRTWGVGLFPLGCAKLLNAPANTIANQLVDGARHPAFETFWSLGPMLFDGDGDDEKECARLLDHMRPFIVRKIADQDKILAVHSALVDPLIGSVAEFAEQAQLGQRTLERLCRRYFGFPPRDLLRRQRLVRSLSRFMIEPDINWTDAMDGFYHDQAHFVRDFRAFMGMTPSEYAAMDHPVLGAFMRERARIWGAAAQTLDVPTAADSSAPE
ncbi:MAG: helix-turn-helix domain-containing protein [Caenibius sp.]